MILTLTMRMNNPQITQILELLHSISVSPAAEPYEMLKISKGRLRFETTKGDRQVMNVKATKLTNVCHSITPPLTGQPPADKGEGEG